MGGASITQFGHTRNYYFNTPSAPAPAIPHNLFAQNSPMEIQTPFSRVHTCTHAHQHTKLTDCRAILQIRNNNREFHSSPLGSKMHNTNTRAAQLRTYTTALKLPSACMYDCLCACLSPSSNSETCLAFSEKELFKVAIHEKKKHAQFAQLLTVIARALPHRYCTFTITHAEQQIEISNAR
uniref:(northern house mosquito) hypothetical protein n=1 Tax=Culex pipiens TaxID=7175 RepID=A0A8D8CNS2_CULPI